MTIIQNLFSISLQVIEHRRLRRLGFRDKIKNLDDSHRNYDIHLKYNSPNYRWLGMTESMKHSWVTFAALILFENDNKCIRIFLDTFDMFPKLTGVIGGNRIFCEKFWRPIDWTRACNDFFYLRKFPNQFPRIKHALSQWPPIRPYRRTDRSTWKKSPGTTFCIYQHSTNSVYKTRDTSYIGKI